ncbi:hypothetical protein YTPLAS18_01140 [Nitrospira sp.]|nr:hypothetical protein YTPLAS18_01140 [Nitrospira sp.]
MPMTSGVILVGHGGIPKDCPGDLVTRLKRLEAQRRATHSAPSAEEIELDTKIRHWPRTSATDPYRWGLEAVAKELRSALSGELFAVAYNEYCAPTIQEAAEDLIRQGARRISVITTMFTPGGSHSEVEIPEILSELRAKHEHVTFHYAWPFDLKLVAGTLATQLERFR